MKVTFKFKHSNKNAAYYTRDGFKKKNLAVPLSMFKDAKPPTCLLYTSPSPRDS